jgi:hypothetical protein
MAESILQGDHSSHRPTHKSKFLGSYFLKNAFQTSGERIDGGWPKKRAGSAVSPEIVGKDSVKSGQLRDLPFPPLMGGPGPMNQNQPGSVPTDLVEKLTILYVHKGHGFLPFPTLKPGSCRNFIPLAYIILSRKKRIMQIQKKISSSVWRGRN